MSRILRTICASLLVAASAACADSSPGIVDPGATPCGIGPAQVNTGGNLPALGLGCIRDRYTSELWVHGAWGYTGTWARRGASGIGNALYVWDVTGSQPVLRDSVLVADAATLGDVQVTADGRYLVVATEVGRGSIVVYDLADPRRPQEIARHSTAAVQAGVHTAEVQRVNGKLYAFLSVPTSPATVVTVDLSDPSKPREVWVQQTGSPFTHDVFVRDGILFTAGWNAGTAVWDIGGGGRGGTPESPVRLADVRTANGKVHNLWWYHDPGGSKRYLFVGEEGPGQTGVSSSGDIHVVDVGSGWTQAREVAFYTVPNAGTHNFWVDEPSGILYAAYYNGGVRALDVRGDLGACTEAQKTDLPDAVNGGTARLCDLGKMGREAGRALVGGGQVSVWGVQMVGNRLYASEMLNGLWKVDVSSLKR